MNNIPSKSTKPKRSIYSRLNEYVILLRKLQFDHYLQIAGILTVCIWILPYFTTRNLIELGDFSFFSQAYEAIRVSILDYHQFPWWNPWMNGGVPLYANPQMGVFSIQTIFVLIFGTVMGLKIAMALYTLVGYFSMYVLLNKFFKIKNVIAVPLSLSWIFSSFFVFHLPTHFTFLWFMLVPLFVYLALVLKTYKQGLLLGGLLAIMALSAVHYSLFYICSIVALIIILRFFFEPHLARKKYAISSIIAAITFLVLAGHRILLAYKNVVSFNREITYDPSITIGQGLKAVLLPFNRSSLADGTGVYPTNMPFGWGEATATIGIILSAVAFFSFVYFLIYYKKINRKKKQLLACIVLVGILIFITGLGNIGHWSPYGIIKELPVLGNLRVSTRWFIFLNLALLLFIALVVSYIKRPITRNIFIGLIYLGCIELLLTNIWYQNNIFTHSPDVAQNNIQSYNFDQTDVFGKTVDFPNGKRIKDRQKNTYYYSEYEATTYNIGVIRANEALVNNLYADKVRCAIELGCSYIKSNNAKVVYWSPNKIILERLSSGVIDININNSSYYKVNGNKSKLDKTVDVTNNLLINDPNKKIEILIKP